MRRRLVIALALTACPAAPEPAPAECRPYRTWTVDDPSGLMPRSECVTDRVVVPTERFALCLDPFAPGRAPVGRFPWRETPDPWNPKCGQAVVWPCERGVACGPKGCTCICDHAGDCAAAAVAEAYAGALPHGVVVACEAERCVWSAE